jgi:hypothetical protein
MARSRGCGVEVVELELGGLVVQLGVGAGEVVLGGAAEDADEDAVALGVAAEDVAPPERGKAA